ncbi:MULTISPECIES: glucose-6-phosphate dehydrogenase [Leeuwenhoekiella]|uniref:Glucose-6-phosphate 1-dehydrogenase n=1 Tax=Leeuwenhoekiella palythoae TaxID=573501 RepID=A0A1M5Y2M9_9FLAO|nr:MULTISPECIES: glucose-6-phosphate dehydrogenase [Leeuwenhoekiella]MEC7784508.1 glucose-6-phosphate dehydrogenase [Bacteroidota bacterium]MEE3226954.1 glucose-6-phosphate dehydrogenase [Bacteroidota bacterium]RXG30428.1 glucose-6-phosphate 1-dehydrogenase [Leeuwenhoekiella palythoae]UBZ10580.1 glucose-6-phosphate dehydrogenase [Leeuwenhoekiella palythoae]SHI06179.1 glucose-6-phosphate 1-dehydrogenase [Leeuwenhoekiella palythoae]|tara:strand:- start:658 stop:2196 length:1539 start_codon:yes stop_codon:yes gene_type:complete
MNKTSNQLLVIFGASGDLTARKLIPALYNLYEGGHFPENFAVLGASRSDMSDEEFRKRVVYESPFLKDKLKKKDDEFIKKFADMMFYSDLGDDYDSEYSKLNKRITSLNEEHGLDGNYSFYLSTPPSLFEPISKNLSDQGLTKGSGTDKGFRRIIVEKPFGYSLETAKELNAGLQKYFKEKQIYRIDHYLGKETVQNLMVTRFSNSIFEPLWNRNYIHHVEITNAETVGVEKRGGYYDKSGALRDMFQSHLLQIVSLIVMEPPISADADEIHNEKVKALKSIRRMTDTQTLFDHTMKGQYVASSIDGKRVKGYREEEGVDPDSKTETYAAIKFFVDNWRWKDVPFYVRTAKRMPTKVTEVVIHFKTPHHQVFKEQDINNKDNKLVIRIQPDEGILIKFGVKVPGQGFKVERANMDFYYSSLADKNIMDAYERLLLDAMQGDTTLYARADEVEAAWAFVDPILEYWANDKDVPTYGYPAGTWGPKNSDDLIEDSNGWRNPGELLTDETGFCII